MRFAICLTLCLFIATSFATNVDTLQQMYNGYFEQGGLADPTTIMACYDENSAGLTVTFISTILQQLANYDVFDIDTTVKTYESQLPASVKTCVSGNAEYQNVQKAYNMVGLTLDQVESQVANYAFQNLAKVHNQADSALTAFQADNFDEVGKQGGIIAKAVFGSSKVVEEVGDSIADLQLLANGFWEQAGLSDPTTVTNCFDQGSANLTVNFIGNLLNALANSNIKAAESDLETFNNSLPETVKTCLAGNYETTTVLQKYKIYGLTIQQLESKIESYALWHMLTLHHGAVIANGDFQAGNYKAVGQEGGSIIGDIFGGSENTQQNTDDYKKNVLQKYFKVHYGRYNFGVEEVGDSIANLQLLANGFWEQAGLSDPTTVTNCFDQGSANLTVNFIGNILNALANSNIKAAESDLVTFNNSLPETVKTCLAGNYETTTVLQKYRIYGLTIQQLESKIESYAIFHMLTLHHGAVIANGDFQAGNYKAVGQEGGSIIEDIFGSGKAVEAVIGTAQDDLQTMAVGFWVQGGLADPTTIIQCFDESSANLTLTFIGNVINDVAKNSINKAQSDASAFAKNLPQSVQDCVKENKEFQQVLQAYKVAGLTTAQIESKVKSYALLHYLKLHQYTIVANSDFQDGNYKSVGKEGGVIVQSIFGKSLEEVGDAQDDLQLLANGFWEQAGLADPTSLSTCFDENSANITVTFIGDILNDLANSNIKGAEADLEAFEQNLPATTKACVNSNPEITQALQAYNIYGLSVQQLESKVESYALWHMIALHHDAVIANSDFQAGNYKAVGQEGGYILQSVFGKNNSAVETIIGTAQANLQLMAIGFWVQGGLTDPSSIVQCFDESSANLTLTFIGNVINDAAKNNINKAESDAAAFEKSLPQSVQDCVKNNAEFQQVLQAYKVAGLTPAQIESKVKSYALLHYFKLHQYTIVANSDFQDGNYKSVGQEGGVIVQSIFGKSLEEVGDSIADLQLLANGFWEQAGLSDPTTVTNCFDQGSANLTVNFIGNLLNALANSNIKAAESDLETFNNSLPETVKTCLAGNYETTTVLQKYKIYGLTIQQLESKIESYALWHMLTLHHGAVIANGDFQAGNYKAVGQEGGSIIEDIFGGSESAEDTDYEAIAQQYFNGFFEQANLSDPTTIINDCFVPQTAQMFDEFIANVVHQLATKAILAAESAALSFLEEFPKATQQCIYKNAEFQQAAQAYGIVSVTPVQMVEKVVAYAFQHGQQLLQYTSACDQAIQAANYDQAGKVIGQGLQAILPTKSLIPAPAPKDDPLQDLSGLLDGFWENVNLADPTSAISCFDEPNAQIALTFVSELFSDLANDNLLDLPSAISNFQKQISPSVMSCLSSSPDIQSVGQAYGVTGVSTATLVAKVAKYALLHAGQFHSTAVQLNSDYSSAQYDAAGRLSGQLLQAMLSTEAIVLA